MCDLKPLGYIVLEYMYYVCTLQSFNSRVTHLLYKKGYWNVVALWSKGKGCCSSPAEIVGSKPTGGTDVCLLCVLCVVRQRSLRRIDLSSRGVLPTVARRCVWSRNLVDEEAIARAGLQSQSSLVRHWVWSRKLVNEEVLAQWRFLRQKTNKQTGTSVFN
jgi:hypothetical protein